MDLISESNQRHYYRQYEFLVKKYDAALSLPSSSGRVRLIGDELKSVIQSMETKVNRSFVFLNFTE